MNSCDPNDAWIQFRTTLMDIIDKIAPVKEVRTKQHTEPWMTSDILDKIAVRDKLLHNYNLNKNNKGLYEEFCKTRNQVQRDIKQAKSTYLESQLDSNMLNSKKLWRNLKSLGYNKKTPSKGNIVLRIANKICFNAIDICNHINQFFINIASNLVNALPCTQKKVYN